MDIIEEAGSVIVSYGKDKEPVSLEFLSASIRRLIRPSELSVTLEAKIDGGIAGGRALKLRGFETYDTLERGTFRRIDEE